MLGLFYFVGISVVMSLFNSGDALASSTQARFMTLNLCEEGPARGIKGAKKWAELIRKSGADIVGLQEIYDYKRTAGGNHDGEVGDQEFLRALVKELGWNKLNEDTNQNTCVITHFPTNNRQVILPNGRHITPLSIHLTDTPYQVCQLYGCKYDGSPAVSSEAAAIISASSTRTKDLSALLQGFSSTGLETSIIMGDLNEPSHLDWTKAAAQKGLYLLSVAWPTTQLLERFGFHDAFRIRNKNEVKIPGHTYPSPKWPEKYGVPTRIDYIFSKFKSVIDSGVFIQEKDWPSDHLGVWADIAFHSEG
jgi:exodeoxyribonuclease-3